MEEPATEIPGARKERGGDPGISTPLDAVTGGAVAGEELGASIGDGLQGSPGTRVRGGRRRSRHVGYGATGRNGHGDNEADERAEAEDDDRAKRHGDLPPAAPETIRGSGGGERTCPSG
jgi:hypothetical protein